MADILGKVDEKVLQAKINSALDMLQKGEIDEIVKKINKMDKNELLEKINEIDEYKLKAFNINKEEIRQKVSDADLNRLAKMLGEHGDEIVKKFKDIIG